MHNNSLHRRYWKDPINKKSQLKNPVTFFPSFCVRLQ